MKPSDAAAIRALIADMDAEGAARELALVLNLERDATDLIGEIIRESFQAGRHEAHVEFDKQWSEEAWP